ncbi:hypothetical protein DSECCO2_549730 [anaerobic digester metagenome]
MPSTGTMTERPRMAAPVAVCSTAPSAVVPVTMTVCTPSFSRMASRSVRKNLSTVDWTMGSPGRGRAWGRMVSGVPLLVRLCTTGMPAALALARNSPMLGAEATQRGRVSMLQVLSSMSRTRSAVSVALTSTALSSTGAGAFTAAHSSTTVPAVTAGDWNRNSSEAMTKAKAEAFMGPPRGLGYAPWRGRRPGPWRPLFVYYTRPGLRQ